MQNPSKYTATHSQHFLNTSSTLPPRFHSICSTALFPVPGQQHPSKKVNSKEPFRSCNAGVKANAVGFLSTSADRKNSQNPSRYDWSEWESRHEVQKIEGTFLLDFTESNFETKLRIATTMHLCLLQQLQGSLPLLTSFQKHSDHQNERV